MVADLWGKELGRLGLFLLRRIMNCRYKLLMKHTKILATFGPSINSVDCLKDLIVAGVNAFRVNCSHGEKSDFVEAAAIIREASKDSQYPVGLLFDISGPKLRLEHFDGEIALAKGDEITFTKRASKIDDRIVGVNHPAIISSVKQGERMLIDDGNLLLEILSANGEEVVATALNDYTLLPAKGINLPETDIQIPTITEKDREDIKTAVEVGANFIALSFVRSGDDVIEARRLLKESGGDQKIIAKLEKREAIENLDEIMMLADGVMVARGDLGVELPPEELPGLQKRIIHLANKHHRPVIVATQMLESMRFSPRATRAEINDVASAVFDHADAVMLSAETASGDYPLEAVRAMAATITAAERDCQAPSVDLDKQSLETPIPYAIAGAVGSSSSFCDTKVIFALTSSGYTARLISSLFPARPIVALSSDKEVLSHLSIYRSVYPVSIKQLRSIEDLLKSINEVCSERNLAGRGDRVAITGGLPFGSNASTNFMMIHEVG